MYLVSSVEVLLEPVRVHAKHNFLQKCACDVFIGLFASFDVLRKLEFYHIYQLSTQKLLLFKISASV